MMFVARNDNGQITGAYASPQPGKAEEWLEDDNPTLQAFLTRVDRQPKWERLQEQLRGGSLFARAFSTSHTKGWALLLASLNSNSPANDPGRLENFQFAIAAVRQGLDVDFSPEEIAAFNQLLSECGFDIQVD